MTSDTRDQPRIEAEAARRRIGEDESPQQMPAAEEAKEAIVAPTQVVAGALASVTAAVVGSTLGVAGTIIGAAVASVIATVGSAFYSAWLRRGREVVLRTAKVGTGRLPVAAPVRRMRPRLGELPWKSIAGLATASLVLGLAALTAVEALAGGPVSGGDDGGSGRTTIGGLVGGGTDSDRPDRDQDETPQDVPGDEPEPEPTEAPEPEPTVEPEPTEEPEPTQEPTEEPAPEPEPAEPAAP